LEAPVAEAISLDEFIKLMLIVINDFVWIEVTNPPEKRDNTYKESTLVQLGQIAEATRFDMFTHLRLMVAQIFWS